jgi:hypothetical protein
MEHAYLHGSPSTARYEMASCNRPCSVTPKWNIMDHEAGYKKISGKGKGLLCLLSTPPRTTYSGMQVMVSYSWTSTRRTAECTFRSSVALTPRKTTNRRQRVSSCTQQGSDWSPTYWKSSPDFQSSSAQPITLTYVTRMVVALCLVSVTCFGQIQYTIYTVINNTVICR